MALWSVSLLILSITYLTYRHPPSSWTFVPQWLRPVKRMIREQQYEHATKKHQVQDDRKLAQKESATVEAEEDTEKSSSKIPSPPTISAAAEEEEDKTPKAEPVQPSTTVPSFALDDTHTHTHTLHHQSESEVDQDENEGEEEGEEEDNLPPPVFPALNSAQRASAPTKPAIPTPSTLMPPPSCPSSSPMPPPSRPSSNLMPPPSRSASSSLRAPNPPRAGPLPNRGPPLSSAAQSRASLAAPPSRIDTPNSRNKVQLTPGHSPLDWAALSRNSNLSGVPTFTRVTPSQLKKHNGRKGVPAWSVYQGKVYNVSPYLAFHPGGEGELLRGAGKDGTRLFVEVHPWVNWENMLQSCLVGIMVSESEADDEGLEGLD